MNHEHAVGRIPILVLYAHSRCDCRCVMCDIWKTQAERELTPEDLERHAPDIERLGVRWVVFSGGEPLMNPGLFRMSQFLRGRGIRTTALSTGLLLEDHAAAVACSLDEVIVSLDGPRRIHDRIRRVDGAFEKLSAGIRAVRATQADFPFAARTTVQRANHPFLRETVAEARVLGVRSISFLAADVTSSAFNRTAPWPEARQTQITLTQAETDALEMEVERLIEELPELGGFVLESPDKLRRIVRHFRAYLGLTPHAAPLCNAPWVSAVVETDGTVRPCFFHRAIGNWNQGSLLTVLNGPEALQFRQGLDISRNPVCAQCVCSLHLQGDRLAAKQGAA